MVTVGERYSTDVKDLRLLSVKLVAASLKYVDRKALWAVLFGPDTDEYIHWELVDRLPSTANVFGDTSVWLSLLSMCTWDGLQALEGEIALSHAPLHGLRKAIRSVGLDPGGAEGWTLACRAYVLTLIQGVPTLHALEMLTCQHFKRNTRDACMELLALQADTPYAPDQHMRTLAFALDHVDVNTRALEASLRVVRSTRDELRLNLQLKNMAVVHGRPRLRDRATVSQEAKTDADIELQTWETYKGFTWKHSFPPTLSGVCVKCVTCIQCVFRLYMYRYDKYVTCIHAEGVKTRLYFLASQTTWPWRDHIRAVVQAPAIVSRVASFPVTRPDLPVLIQVIEQLSMDGQAPFQQLVEFRVKCFQSFPMTHTQRMTHSQALQLYVAAYQPPHVWKDIWRHLCGVISVQIIRDTTEFVKDNPFCATEVMRLVCKT